MGRCEKRPVDKKANMATKRRRVQVAKSESRGSRKSLKVDRGKFEEIVKNLLGTKPLKREKVKVSKRKPEKLFPPQK
jgi:hypothetical protein